jgi:hypothetical protein
MGSSRAPSPHLVQRMPFMLKRLLLEVAPPPLACSYPLGGFAIPRSFAMIGSRRTPEATTTEETRTPLGFTGKARALEEVVRRKHGLSARLEGKTGGIECTVSIGKRGDVQVSLKGLPDCLFGVKPILSFPAAARVDGITWEQGPRRGIVQASAAVTGTGELECRVTHSASRPDVLPALFGRIRIMSPEEGAQPACSIGIAVEAKGC